MHNSRRLSKSLQLPNSKRNTWRASRARTAPSGKSLRVSNSNPTVLSNRLWALLIQKSRDPSAQASSSPWGLFRISSSRNRTPRVLSTSGLRHRVSQSAKTLRSRTVSSCYSQCVPDRTIWLPRWSLLRNLPLWEASVLREVQARPRKVTL